MIIAINNLSILDGVLAVVIKNASKRIHLEIQQHRKKPVGLFRTTYYDHGKIKHDTIGRVTGVGLQELKLIQA